MSDKLTIEKRLILLEKNVNKIMKQAYQADNLAKKVHIDTQHMFKIVKQMHKEHAQIMQLNGHRTLLTVIDKLSE